MPEFDPGDPILLADAAAGTTFMGLAGAGDEPSRSRRLTRALIRTLFFASAGGYIYEAARQAISPRQAPSETPATIVLLGLAFALAAYVVFRNRAGLLERRAEEKAGLTAATEQAFDAILITDTEGTIQYVNPSFTRLTGYSAGEVIGRNPRFLKSGLQNEAFYRELWRTVRSGEVWRGEISNRRKDGTIYTEEMTITPVRGAGGSIGNYIAIKQDVTERRAAEEMRAFLASIVEFSEDAIIGATPQGGIVSWNRGAELLYGYSAAEVVGRPLSMLVPSDEWSELGLISGKLARNETVGHFEGAGLTKEGRRFQISISVCPICNAAGQVTAHAAIIRDISARMRAQEATALLASIVDSASDAIFGNGLDGGFLSWNKGAEIIYGYSASEILGKPITLLVPPDRLPEVSQVFERLRQGETISQFETVTLTRDGKPIDVSLTISPIQNPAGEMVASSTVARNISARKRAERALHESEEKYRMLVDQLPDVVWAADARGRPVFVSPCCERVSGYSPKEICQPGFWFKRIHPDDLERVKAGYVELFKNGRAFDAEYRVRRKDGEWIWLHDRALGNREVNGKRHTKGLISDITERKRMEQALAHQAKHDLLTGLPNRLVFEDRFQQAVARAERSGATVALLHLNLDRFKLISDTLGHQAGDNLLRLAARRLARGMRDSETLARTGGDRFIVLLNELNEPEAAAKTAERILETLSEPFQVKGNEVFVNASIGIALFPRDGHDLLSLQKAADFALDSARRHGKRRYQMFTAEKGTAASQNLALESELHYALERGELSLHYQPQFDLATNRVAGMEALVRWQSPKHGLVPPSILIPIAEESGLIIPIGVWILGQACRQARSWRQAGLLSFRIAVNISAVQFACGDLAATVARALTESGLDGSALELELTESVIMQDVQESARQLAKLKELGVSVSLDDFGTGHSSLSYLEDLPIDNLKIDRSFVQRMNGADSTRTLVGAIVGLAHGLGMRAIAEGAETEQQLNALRQMGCDHAQSFLLARPAPAISIQSLLAARQENPCRGTRLAKQI